MSIVTITTPREVAPSKPLPWGEVAASVSEFAGEGAMLDIISRLSSTALFPLTRQRLRRVDLSPRRGLV